MLRVHEDARCRKKDCDDPKIMMPPNMSVGACPRMRPEAPVRDSTHAPAAKERSLTAMAHANRRADSRALCGR